MLTHEDLNALRYPLPTHEHEFLNGNVYLTEFAITMRIEDVDPAWSLVVKSIDRRDSAGDGGRQSVTVTVTVDLTIKGVTRSGVGMAVAQASKPITDKKTGEVYTNEANEAEKAAATDALKRAARLFGIGRYLLKCNARDMQSLDAWLKRVIAAKERQNGAAQAG